MRTILIPLSLLLLIVLSTCTASVVPLRTKRPSPRGGAVPRSLQKKYLAFKGAAQRKFRDPGNDNDNDPSSCDDDDDDDDDDNDDDDDEVDNTSGDIFSDIDGTPSDDGDNPLPLQNLPFRIQNKYFPRNPDRKISSNNGINNILIMVSANNLDIFDSCANYLSQMGFNVFVLKVEMELDVGGNEENVTGDAIDIGHQKKQQPSVQASGKYNVVVPPRVLSNVLNVLQWGEKSSCMLLACDPAAVASAISFSHDAEKIDDDRIAGLIICGDLFTEDDDDTFVNYDFDYKFTGGSDEGGKMLETIRGRGRGDRGDRGGVDGVVDDGKKGVKWTFFASKSVDKPGQAVVIAKILNRLSFPAIVITDDNVESNFSVTLRQRRENEKFFFIKNGGTMPWRKKSQEFAWIVSSFTRSVGRYNGNGGGGNGGGYGEARHYRERQSDLDFSSVFVVGDEEDSEVYGSDDLEDVVVEEPAPPKSRMRNAASNFLSVFNHFLKAENSYRLVFGRVLATAIIYSTFFVAGYVQVKNVSYGVANVKELPRLAKKLALKKIFGDGFWRSWRLGAQRQGGNGDYRHKSSSDRSESESKGSNRDGGEESHGEVEEPVDLLLHTIVT